MTLWEVFKELELLAAVHGWETKLVRWDDEHLPSPPSDVFYSQDMDCIIID